MKKFANNYVINSGEPRAGRDLGYIESESNMSNINRVAIPTPKSVNGRIKKRKKGRVFLIPVISQSNFVKNLDERLSPNISYRSYALR